MMNAISDLKRHEGFRAFPYKDTVGKLTIGYGINLEAGITEKEAEMILVHRVIKIRKKLSEILPCFSSLSNNRQAVLINMAYNLGIEGLLKFVVTIDFIKNKKYDAAADAMLQSKWASQVGTRATELSNLMREG